MRKTCCRHYRFSTWGFEPDGRRLSSLFGTLRSWTRCSLYWERYACCHLLSCWRISPPNDGECPRQLSRSEQQSRRCRCLVVFRVRAPNHRWKSFADGQDGLHCLIAPINSGSRKTHCLQSCYCLGTFNTQFALAFFRWALAQNLSIGASWCQPSFALAYSLVVLYLVCHHH